MPAWVNYREVKAAVSIGQVLERYGHPFRRKGDRLEATCPIHKGENPRHFKATRRAFKCFGCQEGGNVLDLVAKLEGVSVRDAAVLLVQWFELAGTLATARPKTN